MPLHFDYTACKPLPNGDDPTHAPGDDKRWHPVGDMLVLLSPVIGFREITQKNYKQIAQRMALLQAADGPMWTSNIYITEEDVRAFIGLKVNVAPKTDAQFMKALTARWPATVKNADGKPAYQMIHEFYDKEKKDEPETAAPVLQHSPDGEHVGDHAGQG